MRIKIKLAELIYIVPMLIGFVIFRVYSISHPDKKIVKILKDNIYNHVNADYRKKLNEVYKKNDLKAASSLAPVKVKINSISISRSILDFSFMKKKNVIVKAKYTLIYPDGSKKQSVDYFFYTYSPVKRKWYFHFKTNSLSYYLNFL